jgi:hypothetical protein
MLPKSDMSSTEARAVVTITPIARKNLSAPDHPASVTRFPRDARISWRSASSELR